MEYYKLLQLDREPFSNSPDPEYFFNSRQHMGCLQKLELALRLKRGLNVVIGDVGTGKTTLCRQLIRKFSSEADIETHLILDPSFETPEEFLQTILDMICTPGFPIEVSQTEMKEMIKRSLFQSGVDDNKTIILIIDEGQKISESCLEILRELLNYETNTYKLLQIVIFAQLEFNAVLQTHANFADRINLLHHLKPLRFTDTKQLIQHRLRLSSATTKPTSIFTMPALWAIYRASHGYPRKIIHLCHQSILALIIQNQTKAGWALIQSCKKRLSLSTSRKRNILLIASFTCLVALLIIAFFPFFKSLNKTNSVSNSFKIDQTIGTIPVPELSENNTTVVPQTTADIDASDSTIPEEAPSIEKTDLATVDTQDQASPNSDNQEADLTAPPLPLQHPSPPEVLGQLIVKPGDTLSAMTYHVYGTRHRRFLRSVIASNNHIQNPNNIDIGNTIHFPSVILNPQIPKAPFFIVVLDEFDNLSTAMQRLQAIGKTLGTKPNFVSSWSPTHGLRFQIIQKEYFSSRQAARIHVDMIPYAIAARSKILAGWPDGTIFYSDPFKNNAPLSYKARVEIEDQKKTW